MTTTDSSDSDPNESSPRIETYHVNHDWEENASLVTTIVDAVAAVNDLEPSECTPFYDALDPEALDALFRPTAGASSQRTGRVHFQYHGNEITVESSGKITIEVPQIPP